MRSSLNTAVRLWAPLVIFFCLVDAVPVHSTMGELVETSGDDAQDVNIRPSVTAGHRWHLMARKLYGDVKTLRDEQFDRDFSQTANIRSFPRVSTPLLISVCLSRNFSTEKCLERIYSVLTWYKDHLSYIERENLTPILVNDVKQGTQRLLEAINRQLQRTDTQVETTASLPLHENSAWTRKKTAHSILFNFTTVLKETCRAFNYVKSRKTEQQTKDRKETIDRLSDMN